MRRVLPHPGPESSGGLCGAARGPSRAALLICGVVRGALEIVREGGREREEEVKLKLYMCT